MSVEKDLERIAEYEEWLFDREVHLIDHFPDYFKENREVVAFCNAADPELNLFRRRARMSLNNESVLTCDEQGIKSFERMVGITPDPYLSLDVRRLNVLARMNETLPYTEIRLQRMLAALAGWGHFSYERHGAFVQVDLDESAYDAIRPVYDLLKRVLPMNLYFNVRHDSKVEEQTLVVGIVSMTNEFVETPVNMEVYKAERTASVYTYDGVSRETKVIEVPLSHEMETTAVGVMTAGIATETVITGINE